MNTSVLPVLATPSGGVFTVGTGTITPVAGGNTTVVVDQTQSIVQWGAPGSGGIDTSGSERLTFSQAAGLSNSAVLNRIMSGNPTQFDGVLNGADMRIFIVNPAGIVFGTGSQVNVSQLVASALGISDTNFLNATGATPTDFVFEGEGGLVYNRATINANSVYLVGKKVDNIGIIVAPDGLVVMAAGDKVYMAQDGSNVVVELFDVPSDTTPDVRNRNFVGTSNGKIVLAAGDTFSRAIENRGILAAAAGTIDVHAARIKNRGWMTTNANNSAHPDGGTINLTAVEDIYVGPEDQSTDPRLQANAAINGHGGNITLQGGGTVTVQTTTAVSARGGTSTGDGGNVSITGEDFIIDAPIDASPMNLDYEPGTLSINAAKATIANGENPGTGETDTLYERDIETMGNSGTNLVVHTTDGILLLDLDDNGIDGRYGNIELYADGANSFVSFNDTSDVIYSTQGDIRISAGSGGLDIGSLQTGEQDLAAIPGQIAISTHDGGNITAENLTIQGGQGHAEVSASASGDLKVNGNVVVGKDSAIQNTSDGQDAEAVISLKAGNNVLLNGNVQAFSHSFNDAPPTSVTRSYIGVFSGTDNPSFGDATINGDLVATAQNADTSQGRSEATVEIDVWGELTWGAQAADPVADGDVGQIHVESKQSAEDTNAHGDIAQILVKVDGNMPKPQVAPDTAATHMGQIIEGNVFDNDVSPKGKPLTATLVDGPTHAASFTLNADGTYSYTPEAGYFGQDGFTYTASAEGPASDPVSVTITMNNNLPTAGGDVVSIYDATPVVIGVLGNDSDPDGDPLTVTSFNYAGTGTLVLNADNSFTYTPAADFLGKDTFTYSISDGQTGAAPIETTVNITVTLPWITPPEFFMPTGPDLAKTDTQTSGCSALIKWTAAELGINPDGAMEVWNVNGLASPRDIPPCDSCETLKRAAAILSDTEGIHVKALSEVIREFTRPGSKLTEEQKGAIVDAIELRARPGNRYDLAGEYLTALTDYVCILNSELGMSVQEAVKFTADKYFVPLTQSGHSDVAAYVAVRLNALNLFLSLSHLPPLQQNR